MVARIGDEEFVARGVVGERLRSEELARLGTAAPERVEEAAVAIEDLDPVVRPVLGDEHATVGREGDVGRVDELPLAHPVGSELPEERAVGCVGDDPVLVRVGDDERTVGCDARADRLSAVGLRHAPLARRPPRAVEALDARVLVDDEGRPLDRIVGDDAWRVELSGRAPRADEGEVGRGGGSGVGPGVPGVGSGVGSGTASGLGSAARREDRCEREEDRKERSRACEDRPRATRRSDAMPYGSPAAEECEYGERRHRRHHEQDRE